MMPTRESRYWMGYLRLGSGDGIKPSVPSCYATGFGTPLPIQKNQQTPFDSPLPVPTYDRSPNRSPAPLPPSFPSPPPGRYVTLGLLARVCAISLLASILRIMMRPSPAFATALLIVSALSASPSARMTFACLSCSAFSTMNLDRSASC